MKEKLTKVEMIETEYEQCRECPHCGWNEGTLYTRWLCLKTTNRREIPWGEIPKWCPLDEKEKHNEETLDEIRLDKLEKESIK